MNASAHSIGVFDTSGSLLDLSVTSMMVARGQGSGTGTGNATGTATFDLGTIDADNLYLGYQKNANPQPPAVLIRVRLGNFAFGGTCELGEKEYSPNTILIDAAGRQVGVGNVQMPRLEPGTYLLAVRAPADGGPVSVRPAVAGLTPPGDGPPQEVVRRYLALAAGGDEGVAPPAGDSPTEEGD